MLSHLINPNRYKSIQEYLEVLTFTINTDFYVCGEIRFPCVEIWGHTVASFAEKMKRHGWMPLEVEEKKIVKWPFA